MNIYRNEKGGALLLVLSIGGILALFAVIVSSYNKSIEMSYSSAKNRISYEDTVEQFRKQFENPQVCSALLNGKSIAASFSGDGQSLLPIATGLVGRPGPVVAGYKTSSGIKIKDIKLLMNGGVVRSSVKRDLPAAVPMTAAEGEIFIYTDRGTPALSLAKFETLRIKVLVYYEGVGPSAVVNSCFGRSGDAALCTISGNTYNAFSLTGNKGRCEPDEQCLVSKGGIVSSASLCSPPYTAEPVSANIFLCQWCNQNYTP